MASVLKVEDRRKCIGCLSCRQACSRLRGDFSITGSAIDVKTSGGLSGEFLLTICRGCENPACAEACPIEALTLREGGGVLFNREECTKCGLCSRNCSIGAIRADEEGYPIICSHCGYCIKYCPHGCITLKEI